VSEHSTPYGRNIGLLVDDFTSWMSQDENQQFYSLQEAYRQWLDRQGFRLIGDNYTDAVAILLLYLSQCIVRPRERRYLVNDQGDSVILQVRVPEEEEDLTYWEFMTEVNFRKMYREWRISR
jgi:hypothetical protein